MGIGNRMLPRLTSSMQTLATPSGRPATIGTPAAIPTPPAIDPGGRLMAAQLAADRVRKRAGGSGRAGSVLGPGRVSTFLGTAPAKPKAAATAAPVPTLNLNPRPGAWRTY